jgi:hypothetical protein
LSELTSLATGLSLKMPSLGLSRKSIEDCFLKRLGISVFGRVTRSS